MPLKKTYTMREIRAGLKKVRAKLLSGKITEPEFNMNTCGKNLYDFGGGAGAATICGTAACIGGWLAHELGVKKVSAFGTAMERFTTAEAKSLGNPDDPYKNPLRQMFYHFGDAKTPKQGAKAIERYFEGKAPWTKRQQQGRLI